MDLKSYSIRYGYSRARDEMFLVTDTSWAPWYVVHSDNKRRARLNALTHIFSKIPYEDLMRPKVELPKRQHRGDHKETDYPFRSSRRYPEAVFDLTDALVERSLDNRAVAHKPDALRLPAICAGAEASLARMTRSAGI